MTKYTPALSRILLIFSFLLFYCSSLSAQFNRFGKGSDEPDFHIGVSPIVLDKEGIEINFINSMTSYWLAFNEYGTGRVTDRVRSTRLDHFVNLSYGFSRNRRWDLGADFQYTHTRLDNEAKSSPFRILGDGSGSGENFRGLSKVGIRIRTMPFESLPELTLQGSFKFPVAKDENLRDNLDADRKEFEALATFYQPLNSQVYYYLQTQWLTRFASTENNITTHFASAGAFLVIDFYNQQCYLFPGLTYASTLSSNLKRANYQLYGGLGIQYQTLSNISFFLNTQIPFILDTGSPHVDWVRESFSSVALGVRFLF